MYNYDNYNKIEINCSNYKILHLVKIDRTISNQLLK